MAAIVSSRRSVTAADVGEEPEVVQVLPRSGDVAVSELEQLCTRSTVMHGGPGAGPQLIVRAAWDGRWLASVLPVPYTHRPGAVDPATGVPQKSFLRLGAAMARRLIPGPARALGV